MIASRGRRARQREPLETVLLGGGTEEAKTHWWVFKAMSETVHPTLYRPIEFVIDIEARTARVSGGGVVHRPRAGESHLKDRSGAAV